MDRRGVLRLARNGAIAAAVLGGGGIIGARSVMATIAEHDLTRVGQGKPSVVQIHDPGCATCNALRREARRALSGFEECAMVYLVANIKTEKGQVFAARYNVPHVTLLVFNADGELVETLRGMRRRAELRAILAAHLPG
ncbi:hypothetical protein AIOL_003307 [Candidatus Rhodobacter oscarellae]|uniref:Thioredoxin domain-containing protein n=2 Tax=Candidatus Rhodobacter oscarellae TaxID=1675527 RepID=A0A0J9E9I9_9RHOB|nr:hypothetical protein AIOL_003307 [Candidatus Rhodobacter lobularis]